MYLNIKKCIDVLLSYIVIVIIFPVMLIIALVILIADGRPIFFVQNRVGYNKNIFKLYKFRTMLVNADNYLDEYGAVQKGVNRITYTGKILRLCSLDELPNIFNIMKGEMSFIGPRPILIDSLKNHSSVDIDARFSMKPGITGLAQIKGRNKLKWSKRYKYDIFYINNVSFLLDLYILRKTVMKVLTFDGVVIDRNIDEVQDNKRGASGCKKKE